MARYLGLAVVFVFLLASAAFSEAVSDVPRITPEELDSMVARGERVFVVDVRSPGSYERSSVKIKGAVRVAPNELFKSASEFPSEGTLVLYCTWPDEATSARAVLLMKEKGFSDVLALKGGFNAWVSAGLPVEPK